MHEHEEGENRHRGEIHPGAYIHAIFSSTALRKRSARPGPSADVGQPTRYTRCVLWIPYGILYGPGQCEVVRMHEMPRVKLVEQRAGHAHDMPLARPR